MDSADRRSEYRTKIDIIALSFLGSREKDWSSFVYYLFDLSGHGLEIGVVPETGGTEKTLKKTDALDLHLPLRSDRGIFHRGRIMWTNWDENKGFLLCGITLEKDLSVSGKVKGSSGSYYVSLYHETSDIVLETSEFDSADGLLLYLIEDAVKIKTDMRATLDRASAFTEKGGSACEDHGAVIRRMKESMTKDAAQLQAYASMIGNETIAKHGKRSLKHLSDLQTLMRSKVYSSLTKITLPGTRADSLLAQVRDLERRLFVNYNTIALLWLGYLAYIYQNLDTLKIDLNPADNQTRG